MTLILTHISTALRQLARNKGRSVLTMLGIIIGIGSVIFILTAGEIAKNFLLAQISQFGTNVVEVGTVGSFGPFGELEDVSLSEDDVKLIYESSLLPEVEAVSAGSYSTQSLESDGEKATVSIWGDRPEVFPVNNVKAIKGRVFNSAEYQNASRVVVVGERLATDTFNTTNVVGEQVKIGGVFFTIIGVVEDFGGDLVGSLGTEMVFAPISTVRDLFVDPGEADDVTFILIEFAHGTNVESFNSRLEYELLRSHNLLERDEDVFMIMSREQALDIFDTVLLGIQAFISAVAAISLIVGGIGIMNIMLVTVKERTKEIGLRMAIGAKNSSIMSQFLIESVVLTTVGGIAGIVLGLGLSALAVVAVNTFAPDWGVSFVLVPNALIIATAVAVAVGLVFGLYPAVKASKLNPIEALRYE
ncbi:ABC transporter permease [Patescibacteria group bacterium]